MSASFDNAEEELVAGEALAVAVTGAGKGVRNGILVTELAVALGVSGLRAVVLDAVPSGAREAVPAALGASAWDPQRPLEAQLQSLPGGSRLITGAERLAGTGGEEEREAIATALQWLEHHFQHILVNVPAGISDTSLRLLRAIPGLLLAISNEPTALTDAFSLLRVLHASGGRPRILVLVQGVEDAAAGETMFRRFESLVTRHLPLYLSYMGALPPGLEHPSEVPRVIGEGRSPLGRALGRIAVALEGQRLNTLRREPLVVHWRRAVEQGMPPPAAEGEEEAGAALAARCLEEIETAWRDGRLDDRVLQRLQQRLRELSAEGVAEDLAQRELAALQAAAVSAGGVAEWENRRREE